MQKEYGRLNLWNTTEEYCLFAKKCEVKPWFTNNLQTVATLKAVCPGSVYCATCSDVPLSIQLKN